LIFDFTKDKQGGVNYSIMEPSEWKMEKIALEGFEDPEEFVAPYPQKYGGSIPDDARFGDAADAGM